MVEGENKLAISLPWEWAAQKVLGPTLAEIGEDLRRVYAKGRDKLISAAFRKIPNPDDGKQANLRVTKDVLWNGAFTDDAVCAEYFGGILAASRSVDGKDDDAIQFVDVIKSLSSRQLHLHYAIYHSLNRQLVPIGKPVNVGKDSEIEKQSVWFLPDELRALDLRIDPDLNILYRLGLISQYRMDLYPVDNLALAYVSVHATTFGVLLYAAAHNRLADWRSFAEIDSGSFGEIGTPRSCASGLQELLPFARLGQDEPRL